MHRARSKREITTSTATLSLEETGVVTLRWKDDAQFSTDAVEQNIKAMEALCGADGQCCLLIVSPAGMKVAPELMNIDFYREQRGKGNIKALAMATDSMEMYTATKLYFMYHPQPFEAQAFEEEDVARSWLRGFILPLAGNA